MSKVHHFDKYKYIDALQKEIVYFLAVAEASNISKAAESLGIQQSGLSRAMHRLEQDLGQSLFLRKNVGLVLTDTGERFFKAVKDTKKRWEENFNLLLNESDTPSGLIKIGVHASFGQTYLPGILKRICGEFPQIEVEVNPLPSFQTTRKILENEIDFGLVISEVKNPEIVQKNIGSDYLATFQSNTPRVATHFLINPETQMSSKILKKHGSLRKIFIKDYELLAKVALNTDFALVLLPFSVAKNYPALKQVGGELSKAQISLICHKEKLRSEANKKIYHLILAECKSQSSQ